MNTPHDNQMNRELAMAQALVKQGERLAKERDEQAAKAEEQRQASEAGWMMVAKLQKDRDALRAKLDFAVKAMTALADYHGVAFGVDDWRKEMQLALKEIGEVK